ncbi:MAG: putative toxin-antitoxin system toxin component, PIN family [Casimicrobiaceae bacterium]
MRSLPRAVLDTNVVVSALVFARGQPARVRMAWQLARFHPLASTATARELMRVLSYPKFKLTAADQRELLADYLPYCTSVPMPAKRPKLPPCRDPLDAAFLELAIVGTANFLVTGDHDLLDLKRRMRCPIVTVAEFLGSFDAP